MRWPTLRALGIAGAVAGAAALAAPFASRSFWPAPIATIDAPAEGARLSGCFVARGTVAPSTIWRPLWLVGSEDGGRWEPLMRIDPSPGTWERKVCMSGPTGARHRLALVTAARALDAELQRRAQGVPDEIPEWLMSHHAAEQQGGRGRRRAGPGLPAGATPLAAVEVRVAVGDPLLDLAAVSAPLAR